MFLTPLYYLGLNKTVMHYIANNFDTVV